MTDALTARIHTCLKTIRQTEQDCRRTPNTVRLLLVSKTQSPEAITTAFNAGIHEFGESYWQEARDKQKLLAKLPITWHFIGPIQSNKARAIATHFDWVHSLCRKDIAGTMARARAELSTKLQVCIQVNLDDESSKFGCMLDEIEPLAEHILTLPQLNLRGLMAIPKKNADSETSYQTFLKLKTALLTLNQRFNLSLDTLSMGMSDDFIPAIRAGSTYVRIGRAIFNPAA